MASRTGPPPDRFMLWVDEVGGFWVCLGDAVTLGQPLSYAAIDVPILGDLSSRHARIRRDGEGYLIEAAGEVRIEGHRVREVASLVDGCRIDLGPAVKLRFRRPHPLSATARLDFVSHHHTQPSADAVLLMAEGCILGPGSRSHVVCRDWPREVMIYRQGERLFCRTAGPLEIDGVGHRDSGPLTANSRVAGEGFSMILEEIKSKP